MIDLEFVGDYRQPQLSARQRAHGHDGTSAGELSFGDFLDIINPLQHIPLVSTLYREITGDEISPHARILGDTLFSGPVGFVSAVANVFYEEVAGEDIGATLVAMITGEGAEDDLQFAEGEVLPAAAPAPLAAPLETAAGPQPAQAPPADPDQAAILPEPAPGMLTGQDALNALFLDLGGRTPPPAASAAAPPAQGLPLPSRGNEAAVHKSYPLPPRHTPAAPAAPRPAAGPAAAADDPAAAHPLLFAQQSGDGAIADRMMQALDKYQAMSQHDRRENDRKNAASEVNWQSDPADSNGS